MLGALRTPIPPANCKVSRRSFFSLTKWTLSLKVCAFHFKAAGTGAGAGLVWGICWWVGFPPIHINNLGRQYASFWICTSTLTSMDRYYYIFFTEGITFLFSFLWATNKDAGSPLNQHPHSGLIPNVTKDRQLPYQMCRPQAHEGIMFVWQNHDVTKLYIF